MNELTKGAIEAVAEAIKDKPFRAYAEVVAGDVVEIGKAAKKLDPTTQELVNGAAANPPGQRIWQEAGKLRRLLELAKGPNPS